MIHHHILAVPGTGRDVNNLRDAGDFMAILRELEVDLVLSGHRHVPYVWSISGVRVVHSGTVSTLRVRGTMPPSYNVIELDADQVRIVCASPGRAQTVRSSWPISRAPPSPRAASSPRWSGSCATTRTHSRRPTTSPTPESPPRRRCRNRTTAPPRSDHAVTATTRVRALARVRGRVPLSLRCGIRAAQAERWQFVQVRTRRKWLSSGACGRPSRRASRPRGPRTGRAAGCRGSCGRGCRGRAG